MRSETVLLIRLDCAGYVRSRVGVGWYDLNVSVGGTGRAEADFGTSDQALLPPSLG
jgi:hypothetical protein